MPDRRRRPAPVLSVPQAQELLARVRRATGSDPDLDTAIAAALDSPSMAEFTRSIDACLELIHQKRPGWSWHIGWGANGVMPYVTLSRGEDRYEARAPTIPLALLDALLQVEVAEATGAASRPA